jgi:diaminopimelate epimerase
MSKLSFTKYHGAGNDFILVDDRPLFFPTQDALLIQRLCHRQFGIGADGLILLQEDGTADFRMRIYNADGREAKSCGNGLRCLLRFVADLGCPKRPYQIATGSGVVRGDYAGDQLSVEMGEASRFRLHPQMGDWTVHSVQVGVPHAVVFVPDVGRVDLEKWGKWIRSHEVFGEEGANVNFASLQPDGSIRVRTFERGVEGETLACGTGAMAVAAIAAEVHCISSPVRMVFLGGVLDVYLEGERVRMVGPALKVFEGSWAESLTQSR